MTAEALTGQATGWTVREDVREAALRPMARAGWRFWALVATLTALTLPGLGAYVYQLRRGLGVTGLDDQVFWGVYTANLIAFIGISYGGAVVSAILRLTGAEWRAPITRLAEAMAAVSLGIGAMFAMIHVGHPERLWRLAFSPNASSPLIWDAVAIGTYFVATIVLLYLPLIPDFAVVRDRAGGGVGSLRRRLYGLLSLGWRNEPHQRRRLGRGMTQIAVLIIPLAITVHSVLAWAFGLTSRAGWHSTAFGPYFVVGALLSGIGAVILVVAGFRRAYHLEAHITVEHFRRLATVMLVLGLLYLYLTVAEFLTEGYLSDESNAPMLESLLLKDFAPLFWTFVVLGGAVPTLLVSIPRTRTINGIVVAATLAVAGLWLKRLLIIVPPLAQSVDGEGLHYYGSFVEASITLSAVAAIPLFMMLLFRFIPVISIFEMEEIVNQETATARDVGVDSVPAARTAPVPGFAGDGGS